jgi:dihydrofolate synthase/folylpolyglutamate synthase
MTISECMNYIHKTTWLGSKPGLSRIGELLEKLGSPQKGQAFVHVVGTNGKGSVSSMLSLVLEKQGYKVGTFVSPYIVNFNERIQINRMPISDNDLCRTVEKVMPFAEAMADHPTEFELITAVGFQYFKEQGCDVVVLEAGMGGALDSTNIIDTPLVSVFTAIGLDHKEQLGNTVAAIARTKAGILKKGTEAVFNGEEKAARPVIRKECEKLGIPLTIPCHRRLKIKESNIFGSIFNYKGYKDVRVGLAGVHQVDNAITVIEAAEALKRQGFAISEEAIRFGLANVKWPARFEVLSQKPLILFDGAHNINGVTKLCENVGKYFPNKKLVMLMGVMADKEYQKMLDMMMPLCKKLYAVKPANPRALSAEALADEAKKRGVEAFSVEISRESLAKIKAELSGDDVFLMMGSLYMYGDIVRALSGQESCL